MLAPGIALPRAPRVRVRYRHEGAPARMRCRNDGTAIVRFTSPVRAVSRGQVAVFYDGDRVLGGGRIKTELKALGPTAVQAEGQVLSW